MLQDISKNPSGHKLASCQFSDRVSAFTSGDGPNAYAAERARPLVTAAHKSARR